MNIYAKIRRKLMKLRLQPIRIFCFHQVSDTFDESAMYRCDWLETNEFKRIILGLRNQGYTFISLPKAHEKIKHDVFRFRKYAVLTADDGWASLRNILPWLNSQQIPVTLFINPAYLDGKHFRENEKEDYLTEYEVAHLYEQYPLLTIGSHGWDHIAATDLSVEEFNSQLNDSLSVLRQIPNFISFYAFPYGEYTMKYINQVIRRELIPVIISGGKNYDAQIVIDREGLKSERNNEEESERHS